MEMMYVDRKSKAWYAQSRDPHEIYERVRYVAHNCDVGRRVFSHALRVLTDQSQCRTSVVNPPILLSPYLVKPPTSLSPYLVKPLTLLSSASLLVRLCSMTLRSSSLSSISFFHLSFDPRNDAVSASSESI